MNSTNLPSYTNYTSEDNTILMVTLSSLAFVLAPATVASNVAVVVPFCRFSRVRSASNQILLALAITDGLLGLVLLTAALTGLIKISKLVEADGHMYIGYTVAMVMALGTDTEVSLQNVIVVFVAVVPVVSWK